MLIGIFIIKFTRCLRPSHGSSLQPHSVDGRTAGSGVSELNPEHVI